MSHKVLVFNAGIDFSSPADSCHIVYVLEIQLTNRDVPPPHSQHMKATILKSSIL
jgi:hypothetical protein